MCHTCIGNDNMQSFGPSEEFQKVEMDQTLNKVLETITDRERSVLKSRFWDSKTLAEIGREQRISGQAVRMIEAKALRKLRHPIRLKKLKSVCVFFDS